METNPSAWWGILVAIGAVIAAYFAGFSAGRSQGRNEGFSEGRREGTREGSARGFAVGFDRGRRKQEEPGESGPVASRPPPIVLLIGLILAVTIVFLIVRSRDQPTIPSPDRPEDRSIESSGEPFIPMPDALR